MKTPNPDKKTDLNLESKKTESVDFIRKIIGKR
jgi:hypothetical protein